MRLMLKVEVPSTADRDEVLKRAAVAAATHQGITITMADGYAVDVDLVQIENLGTAPVLEEGLML